MIIDLSLLPQDIGGLALSPQEFFCGATVPDTDDDSGALLDFPVSDAILFGGIPAFDVLAVGGDCTVNADGFLDGGTFPHQLGNLAAQTLALSYNIAAFTTGFGFGSQELGDVGCFNTDASFLGFVSTSTMSEVLALANELINDADIGGDSVSRAQVTRMTALLGDCVNEIDGFVWGAYPSGGGGFPFLALLAGVGGAIAIAAVITPGIKASRWRRPNWW